MSKIKPRKQILYEKYYDKNLPPDKNQLTEHHFDVQNIKTNMIAIPKLVRAIEWKFRFLSTLGEMIIIRAKVIKKMGEYDVIIGTTVVRKAAFAFNKFMQNQKEIQENYLQSKLVIATDEPDFAEELKEYLKTYRIKGDIVIYKTEKPDYAKDRIWSIACGREAIRKYALKSNADYLFSVDADMIHDPQVINIIKKEIEGYDVVQSGYRLHSKELNAIGFGLTSAFIGREILENIRFGCYEFKNHQVIDDGEVFERDLVRARAKIKKGIFLKINHYISKNEMIPIEPQNLTFFQKITTLPLLRYILITLSIILKHDISRSLQHFIQRRQKDNCVPLIFSCLKAGLFRSIVVRKDENYLKKFAKSRANSKYAWQIKRNRIYQLISDTQYTSVLDVGCGDGEQLKQYVRDDTFGCGLDIDLDKIKSINNNNSNCFVCSDAQNLPFKDETFDLVTATEVIEHLPDHNRFLGEVHRVLKPNGFLFLSTPNQLQISALIMKIVEFIKGTKFLDVPDHISKLTPIKLKKELKRAGFIIESLDYGAFNPYILPPYVLFRENELINKLYRFLDKLTNLRILKPLFKWDMIVKAVKPNG